MNGGGSRPPGRPQSVEEAIDELFARLRGGPSGIGALVIAVLLTIGWLATGIYQVNPSEIAVVMRFGRVVRQTAPGLHWHAPFPIESRVTVPVTVVKKEELGFRTVAVGPPARYQKVVEEARMLTADGNIVDLDFIVQYRIKDPIAYLFKVRDPVGTLRDCAESAMREVIGHSTIDAALTEGRLQVQVEAQELLQRMLDAYESGLLVTTVKLQDVAPPDPVQDAFKDVIAAEQDKERLINEAEGFANDILPKARGMSAQMLKEAEGYAESIVKDAEGRAGRFELIYAEYAKAPEVTRTRMYLETLEAVLPTARKVIIDGKVASNALPLLPLLGEQPQPAAAEAAQ